MGPKFLTGEPALLLESPERALLIADLHIGIEHEFYKLGIRIPSQLEGIRKRIGGLLNLTKARRLIILGDLKHKVPGLSWQEEREVPEFINKLNRKIPVEIVPGNHDPGLGNLLPGIKMHPREGFLFGDSYLLHGHAWPSPDFLRARHVIIGHNHPMVEFRDRLGYSWREPVWIRARLKREGLLGKFKNPPERLPELVVMPVFNEFAGGMSLNSGEKREFMGPLGKCTDKKRAKIYLLDGTFLGRLEKL